MPLARQARRKPGKTGSWYRFKVNDPVLCRVENQWVAGRVYQIYDNSATDLQYRVDVGLGQTLTVKCDKSCCMLDTWVFRFCYGAEVICLTEDSIWKAGEVIGHDFLDSTGEKWAYEVKLQQGAVVYAPADEDACIRQRFRYAFNPVYDDNNIQKTLKVRFDIGTPVTCCIDILADKWARGTVVEHDFEVAPGVTHPYRVMLQNKKLVSIAMDNEDFIIVAMRYYYSIEDLIDGPELAVRVRFDAGTRVLVMTGDTENPKWERGVVIAINYMQKGARGVFHPYQVELGDGRFLYCPEDNDDCVKRDFF